MNSLPQPPKSAVFYQDEKVYACLANEPWSKGHCVVVWKADVTDLHLLEKAEYEHLMWVVDQVRDALLSVLKLEKVYLLYLDEAKHVHWHLIPRFKEKGLTVLNHRPGKLTDFSLADELEDAILSR